MDNTKRQQLKRFMSVTTLTALVNWHTPIVNRVVLPAHAQMSQCVVQDVVGTWQIDNDCATCTYVVKYELYQDGSGLFVGSPVINMSEVTWSLENNTVNINHKSDSEVSVYEGVLSQGCDEFSGQAGGQDSSLFTATKIND